MRGEGNEMGEKKVEVRGERVRCGVSVLGGWLGSLHWRGPKRRLKRRGAARRLEAKNGHHSNNQHTGWVSFQQNLPAGAV